MKNKKIPSFIKPQLAKITHKYFSDKNWIYEEKLDGIRCIAIKKEGKINLYSRNKNSLNKTFPTIVQELEKQKINDFILDGEIVAYENGVTSFSKLQQVKKEKIKVYYCVFDLLFCKKKDLRKLELIERKKLLKKSFKFSSIFKYTPHILEKGEAFFKKACMKRYEGIIAKKADSKYLSKRTSAWLKFKCISRQEFIIIGYTDPQKSRVGFGSLLIGYYDKKKLCFAGKVGTGFDDEFLEEFSKRLKKIEISKPPFKSKIRVKNAHFVRLKYVAEIGFTEWTKDKKLRHPKFLGLRKDKSPKEVVKE